MKTLVVGDVHGCARELETLLDAVGPDRAVLVGDLFTKGPDPAGVWALIRDRGLASVLGNHDDRLLQVIDGRRDGDRAARRVVEALDHADPSWRGWLRDLPLFREAAGFTVVHAGLHPSGALDRTSREMALTMRWWPTQKASNPFWYQVYTGTRRVIFGHDAVRGLVRVVRDDEPVCVGLDTGCVYGGRLSGYVVEEDRVVQVQAARAYHSVG